MFEELLNSCWCLCLSVPPLEGFVMNRVQGDYFETLLYKIFVSIDEQTNVAEVGFRNVFHYPLAAAIIVRECVCLFIDEHFNQTLFLCLLILPPSALPSWQMCWRSTWT